ncbi:YtxH domain-containing protein [Acidobacterium sp. S8]|uniref:YtxH domain-containing protein n=1 Tax=Acidobacterium sp. S8 TaxID=1641854 RepID=UPI00131D1932|nr:YtxH domain-containing protein [Acidobacterium sp. S8]
MNPAKFWAVFTIGVVAGAAVALLYAPQAGEKTRKQVRRRLEDAGDYVKDTADTISDRANKAYKVSKGAVEDAFDTASSVYDAAAKRVQQIV